MGYLHFDRVKIPQENLIFNDSSSIQLSSVNRLLKEHGIVLNNDDSNEEKATKQEEEEKKNLHIHSTNKTSTFDDFLSSIIATNKNSAKMEKNDELFFSSSKAATGNNGNFVFSPYPFPKKKNISKENNNFLENSQVSLSLDEELVWKASHSNNNDINFNKDLFSGPISTPIRNNTATNTYNTDLNFPSSSSSCSSPSSALYSKNKNVNKRRAYSSSSSVLSKEKRKDLLNLKQLGSIVEVPEFKNLKDIYKCSVHKISKRGRGRKMKCCQTADDMFRIALKQRCDSLGIHDYSMYKRGRGRPRKSMSTSRSASSSQTPSFTEHENYNNNDANTYNYIINNNNNNLVQENDSITAGSVIDQCNNNNNNVQFKLNQMQKQLEEQQSRLNNQIKNMNTQQQQQQQQQQQVTPLAGIMALLQQQPSSESSYKQKSQQSQVLYHQQEIDENFKEPQMSFVNTDNINDFIIHDFILPTKSNNYTPSSMKISTQDEKVNSHFDTLLSPISLTTSELVSPGRLNKNGAISNLNSILANNLMNNISQQQHQEHVPMVQENVVKSQVVAGKLVEIKHDHSLIDNTTLHSNCNNSDSKFLLQPKKPKSYKKKLNANSDEKYLHHISGKKIEIDPVTKKLKCLFEGCDSQFKQKAYLSRHMKKHSPIKDYLCPYWSTCSFSDSGKTDLFDKRKTTFEKKLSEKNLTHCVSDKAMNRYVTTIQCHSKGNFTRKDEFLMHLKSFHVATDFKELPNYACCVECGKEFGSIKEWYDSHVSSLECQKIINKEFNKGRELRRKYEKEIREKERENSEKIL